MSSSPASTSGVRTTWRASASVCSFQPADIPGTMPGRARAGCRAPGANGLCRPVQCSFAACPHSVFWRVDDGNRILGDTQEFNEQQSSFGQWRADDLEGICFCLLISARRYSRNNAWAREGRMVKPPAQMAFAGQFNDLGVIRNRLLTVLGSRYAGLSQGRFRLDFLASGDKKRGGVAP